MSPQSIPLVLRKEPVPRSSVSTGAKDPHVAVIYATANGDLDDLGGGRVMHLGQALWSRYRYRYDVDTGDHEVDLAIPAPRLPSSEGAFFFVATMHLGFRVTDAVAVIRRNIQDGLAVVRARLEEILRIICMRYPIDQASQAEIAVNAHFAAPVVLAEGITIYRCVAQLSPDAGATGHLQNIRSKLQQAEIGRLDHDAAVAGAHSANVVDAIKVQGENERRRQQADAIAALNLDERKLLELYVAQHPENAANALALLHQWELARQGHEDARHNANMKVLQFLVDNNAIRGPHILPAVLQILGTQGAIGPGASGLPPAPVMPALPGLPPMPTTPMAPPTTPAAQPATPSQARPTIPVQPTAGPTVTPPQPRAAPVPPHIVSPQATPTGQRTSIPMPPATGTPPAQGAGSGPGPSPVDPLSLLWPAPPAPTPTMDSRLPPSSRWPSAPPAAPAPAATPAPSTGQVQPVYVVVDESTAVAPFAPAIDSGMASLFRALADQPGSAAGLRLTILTFSNQVRTATTFNGGQASAPPTIAPHGTADYAAVFTDLLNRVPADVDQLKQGGGQVIRPVVYVLSASPVADNGWVDVRARLADRQVTRAAPTIVACGIGSAPPGAIAAMATNRDLGLVAPPDLGVDAAVAAFWRSVVTSMLGSGAALARGESALAIKRPDGFVLASPGG